MFTTEEKTAIREWLVNADACISGEANQSAEDMRKGIKEMYLLLSHHFAQTFETEPYNYAKDALVRARYIPTNSMVTIIGTSETNGKDLLVFIDTDGHVKGDLPRCFERAERWNRMAVPRTFPCDDRPHNEGNVGNEYLVVAQPSDDTCRDNNLTGTSNNEMVVARIGGIECVGGGMSYYYEITEVFSKPDQRYLRPGMKLWLNDIVAVVGRVMKGH